MTKSSGYKDVEGGGVCCFPWGFAPPISSVGLCEESKVSAPHKSCSISFLTAVFGQPAVNRHEPPWFALRVHFKEQNPPTEMLPY